MSVDWRIYYGDASTYDSNDGAPFDAPRQDVQAIVQHDENVGRTVMAMFDWYYWRPELGEWWGSDLYGLLDWLTNKAVEPIEAVMSGRHAHNPLYAEIMERAKADTDFDPKSAGRRAERP